MDDAYVIGIRLALDNGVSEGVAAIRGELVALDRAVAGSVAHLDALRRAASAMRMPASPSPVTVEPPSRVEAKPVVAEAPVVPPVAAAAVGAPVPPRLDVALPGHDVPAPGPLATTTATPMTAAPVTPTIGPFRDRSHAARPAPIPDVGQVAKAAAPVLPVSVAPVAVPVLPAKPLPAPTQLPSIVMPAAKPVAPLMPPTAEPARLPAPARPLEMAPRSAGERPPVPLVTAMAPAVLKLTQQDFASVGRQVYSGRRSDETVSLERPAIEMDRRPQVIGDRVAPDPPVVPADRAKPLAVTPVGRRDVAPAVLPSTHQTVASGRTLAPRPAVGAADPMPRSIPQAPALSGQRLATVAAPNMAPALPSAVPPADTGGTARLIGDVYLDGTRVGRWLAERMERDAGRPPVGPTFFDPRQSPAWGGATVGM